MGKGKLSNLIVRLALNVAALLVVEYLLPGFELAGYQAAIVAAIVIGVVNTFIRPIIQLIALPISILTFGITALLINVLLLYATAAYVPGFAIASFTTAFIASIMLALVSWFLNKLAACLIHIECYLLYTYLVPKKFQKKKVGPNAAGVKYATPSRFIGSKFSGKGAMQNRGTKIASTRYKTQHKG